MSIINDCKNPKDTHFNNPSKIYIDAYIKYSNDLIKLRSQINIFCKQNIPNGYPHASICLTGITESELLYLRLRITKPKIILELSPAIGFSTFIILQALEDNKDGILDTIDIYDTPWPNVLLDKIKSRWRNKWIQDFMTFDTYKNIRYDYIHIDTCHDEPCIQNYLKHVVNPVLKSASYDEPIYVSMHDAYHSHPETVGDKPLNNRIDFPTTEGLIIITWLSYANSAQNVHSIAATAALNHQLQAQREIIFGKDYAAPLWNDIWKGNDYRSTIYFDAVRPPAICTGCLSDLFNK